MLGVKEKKASYILMISCCVIFLISVGLKSVYSSALVSIQSEFGVTKTETRIGSLIYYVMYGLAQILMVVFIKKINVGKIFLVSVISGAVCYALMLLTDQMWKIWVILGVCGVLDAPLWPGCIYFIGRYLKNEYLTKANSFMSISTPLGFALSFGVVSLFIALNAWRFSYLFLSSLMLLAAFLFWYSERQSKSCLSVIEPVKNNNISTNSKKINRFYFFVVLYVSIFIAVLGGATYSMNQIMPEIIHDVFEQPKAISTLFTTLLPAINAIANVIMFKIVSKGFNYLKIAMILAVAALIGSVSLFFLYSSNLAVLLIFAVIFTCALSATTQIFCGLFPLKVREKYNSASSSALTNGLLATSAGFTPFLSAMLLDLGGGNAYGNVFILIMGITAFYLVMVSILFFTRKKNSLLSEEK